MANRDFSGLIGTGGDVWLAAQMANVRIASQHDREAAAQGYTSLATLVAAVKRTRVSPPIICTTPAQVGLCDAVDAALFKAGVNTRVTRLDTSRGVGLSCTHNPS